MVQMNDVRMVYGNTEAEALSGVSFTINEGEFVFLVGPSGSGKTTIIKLITGELSPTSGQITVNGFDMQGIKRRKLPKLRRTLGVIFQDFRLIDKMTVYENVAFAMRVVGASIRRSAAVCRRCSSWSASSTGKNAIRRSCPAVSSSAWRSPARS